MSCSAVPKRGRQPNSQRYASLIQWTINKPAETETVVKDETQDYSSACSSNSSPQPIVTYQPQSSTYQPPTINNHQSTSNYKPPNGNYEPPISSFQQPNSNYQPASTDHPTSTYQLTIRAAEPVQEPSASGCDSASGVVTPAWQPPTPPERQVVSTTVPASVPAAAQPTVSDIPTFFAITK